MKKAALTVTKDFTDDFNKLIKSFKNDNVVVGIPQSDKPRKDEEDDTINNAALFAMANFGSAANNIPPWPIMAIGIKAAQAQIAEEFKKAAASALTTGLAALDVYYKRAGIIASTSIKKVLNSQQGIPEGRPLQSTLDARTKGGNKYWLVTGQMRNAITYVVQRKGI